jgi:putative oxidoreductase
MVGAGKVFGWFGGMGMSATLQAFAKEGFSAPLIYLSMFTEFVGGFLFIVGFLTRPVAIAVTINMLVATLSMMPHGFLFGFADFPFSILVSSIIILLAGPMDYSIDSLLFARKGS